MYSTLDSLRPGPCAKGPGRWHIAKCASLNAHRLRRSCVHARAALFNQVIRDPDTLARVANKYGLAVTELKEPSLRFISHVEGQGCKGLGSQQEPTVLITVTTEQPAAAQTLSQSIIRSCGSWIVPAAVGAALVGLYAAALVQFFRPSAPGRPVASTEADAAAAAAGAEAAAALAAEPAGPEAVQRIKRLLNFHHPAAAAAATGRPAAEEAEEAAALPGLRDTYNRSSSSSGSGSSSSMIGIGAAAAPAAAEGAAAVAAAGGGQTQAAGKVVKQIRISPDSASEFARAAAATASAAATAAPLPGQQEPAPHQAAAAAAAAAESQVRPEADPPADSTQERAGDPLAAAAADTAARVTLPDAGSSSTTSSSSSSSTGSSSRSLQELQPSQPGPAAGSHSEMDAQAPGPEGPTGEQRLPRVLSVAAGSLLDTVAGVLRALDSQAPSSEAAVAGSATAAAASAAVTAAAGPSQPPATSAAAVATGTSDGAAASGSHSSAAPAGAASASSIAAAKARLLDSLYGTGRGLTATPEQRAAVEERLRELEALGAQMAPSASAARQQLEGSWRLVYSDHTPTLMVLSALRGLPLVDLGEVVQVIEPGSLQASNKIDIAIPFLISLTAHTDLSESQQPGSGGTSSGQQGLTVKFTSVGLDTHIHTPQLLAALQLPSRLDLLGARFDLSPLQGLVEQLNAGLGSALGPMLHPEFQVPAAGSEASALWLLNTYLDEGLRVSRDARGKVFVMMKETAAASPAAGGAGGAGGAGAAGGAGMGAGAGVGGVWVQPAAAAGGAGRGAPL